MHASLSLHVMERQLCRWGVFCEDIIVLAELWQQASDQVDRFHADNILEDDLFS